jgi:hypothetical protein
MNFFFSSQKNTLKPILEEEEKKSGRVREKKITQNVRKKSAWQWMEDCQFAYIVNGA